MSLDVPTAEPVSPCDCWLTAHDERRPTSAELLGLDVTIGIVALAWPHFVAVSDQRVSFDDFHPPTERGARKIIRISENYHAAFAATEISNFKRVVSKIMEALSPYKGEPDRVSCEKVMQFASDCYSEALREEFAARHLAQLGYSSVEQFRREGHSELGSQEYGKYLTALARFDLGVEIIVFGHHRGLPRLFSVVNPGRVEELNWAGYAVVGSGSTLALGSLRRKPLSTLVDEAVYRVLEAKFTAEGARDVGKTTTVVVLNGDGEMKEMPVEEIDAIRAIWERTQAEPVPTDAIEIIENSHVLKS